ncbi:SDR family NAD(P)-dependent oxidoreductase [Amycolatopsis sp. EV170708-02-1]|uniref:SDR family NAD(P)-dependent oxidoreductase n=1 Tax=Amycolatopsis sp. EV170708-02-1 TaxID=2919322 RepID=UPI001F0C9845|nr:SDR family NAD(P)-dependent oxidoreductase [Amycolatopsis sp. EV170708-02-1]UMP06799.1 SDR family NAD(P)-dependent oxidoreductase [Amycolatopsis sp. EV170708-02-1]
MEAAKDNSATRGRSEWRTVASPGQRLLALVTGATDGIGEAVSHRLAGIVDTLLVHGKSASLLSALAAELAPAHPGTSIVPVLGDLRSFADVRRMTASIRMTFDHIDILINNAATAGRHPRAVTEDGNESIFQVNYLSPVLLVAELYDLLRAARCCRVVNVVCDIHRQARAIGSGCDDSRRYHPLIAYAQSKFALAVHTATLASAFAESRCTAVCLDPGVAETKLRRKLVVLPGGVVSEAADNVLYAATMRPMPREFYLRGKEIVQPEPELLRAHVQRELEVMTVGALGRRLPWGETSETGPSTACC